MWSGFIIMLIHLKANFPDPISTHFVQLVWLVVRNYYILKGIFTIINLTGSFGISFWTVCLVAFFSFLWKSNLFASSGTQFDPKLHLSRQDIILHAEGVTFCFKHILFTTKWIWLSNRLCLYKLSPFTCTRHIFSIYNNYINNIR